MQTVSDDFNRAVVRHGIVAFKVEAKVGGVSQGLLKYTSGSVSETTAPGPRRTMTLDVDPGHFDLLASDNLTLHPYRGFRYANGQREYCPLGVFVVDGQKLGHTSDSRPLNVTCTDYWSQVQRARFLIPEVATGNAVTELVRIAKAAFPIAPTSVVTGTSTVNVDEQTFEKDRSQAVLDLAKAANVEVFFSPAGNLIVRPIPELASIPVWTASVGELGVQLENSRELSRLKVYNVVVAAGTNTDSVAVFDPVIVKDTDPASPTFTGTYGEVPFFFNSPLWEDEGQARVAAMSMLERVRAPYTQVAVTQVPHPALECGDTIDVHLTDPVTGAISTQRHLVESITTPLTVDGTQPLGLRSTAPEEL